MLSFTICTNNYLAEALTLGHSLSKSGLPVNQFKIFLCDGINEQINYSKYEFEIIQLDDNIVPDFTDLTKKYQLVELCTSVKPSIFKYIIKKYQEDIFVYLDPDLFFFKNFDSAINELGEASILITPHVITPQLIDSDPQERTFLNYGLYNLGFIMIRKNDIARSFLDWWEERTLNLCFDNPADGLFVDQLWINFVPIYYNQVIISKNSGLNVAYWNLNERKISKIGSDLLVNDQTDLIFFHFSSFDHSLSTLSRRGHKLAEEQCPIIKELSLNYNNHLQENNIVFFKKISPIFKVDLPNYLQNKIPGRKLSVKKIRLIHLLINFLPNRLLVKLINLSDDLKVILDYKKIG